ncbi:MAG: ABC transporter substrate-binding protein [Alphaproteobacteria bacterium]|nr:ABC transporter substrate-binding protein [Alphaproteobacteria bacterium]
MLRLRAVGAALAIAALAAMPVPTEAKPFRFAVSGDANTMDPHSQNAGQVTLLLRQIYEPLILRGKKLEKIPGLATSWKSVDPKRWRFELRRGVKFHDGSDFTADDVVFSIKRALAPTSNYGIYVDTVAEAVRVDDHTVDIVTKIPDPILPDKLTSVFMMDKEWSEKNNAVRPQNTRDKEEMFTVRNTNGTGAYRLTGREADVRTTMARNDAWWGWADKALNNGTVSEITFRPVSSDATRVAALLSGEVDFVLDPPLQDLARLKQNQQMRVLEGPEVRTIFFIFDVHRDELLYSNVKGRNPLKDVRVRRAMYHAVDIEAIKARVMRGQSIPTGTLFPPQVNGYAKAEDVRLPFNPDRARQLLAEAGYPGGFEITLDCPNNRYINDEQICQAAAAMWARVGVNVKLNAMPLATFFPKIQKDDTSFYLLGWGVPTYDALYTFQSLLQSRDGQPGNGIWNYGRYSLGEMDRLINVMKTELDPAKRNAAIQQALRIYRDDVPHIPVHHQMIPWAMRASVGTVHMANNQLEVKWVKVD